MRFAVESLRGERDAGPPARVNPQGAHQSMLRPYDGGNNHRFIPWENGWLRVGERFLQLNKCRGGQPYRHGFSMTVSDRFTRSRSLEKLSSTGTWLIASNNLPSVAPRAPGAGPSSAIARIFFMITKLSPACLILARHHPGCAPLPCLISQFSYINM